jgi:hypothetical protein
MRGGEVCHFGFKAEFVMGIFSPTLSFWFQGGARGQRGVYKGNLKLSLVWGRPQIATHRR